MTHIQLITQIKAAFAEVPKPYNHFGIYTARAHDEYEEPTPEEQEWDRTLDRYDLTPQQMQDCYTALDFLEPAGFHYYLPAYMILALQKDNIKDKALRDLIVFDSADFALTPASDADLRAYQEKRFGRLNGDQIQAILQYFRSRLASRSWNRKYYAEVIAYWEKRKEGDQ